MAEQNPDNLLSIPPNAGRLVVERGGLVACPLLGTDAFVRYCKDRGISIDRARLLRFERLGVFAPIFRVINPPEDAPRLSLPLTEENNWFDKGWALDTTAIPSSHPVPRERDTETEGYYSIFQLDHLEIILSAFTLRVHLDSYLDVPSQEINWARNGATWITRTREKLGSLQNHQYRPAKALLCQFITDRYFPLTQSNQRTIELQTSRSASDLWTFQRVDDWNWNEIVARWDATEVEKIFDLTPQKLRHAFEGLSIAQSHRDPLNGWYQLVQFVNVQERRQLKNDALLAETLRCGAHMLRHLYKDLYGEELPHPNEVAATVITHIPELATRKDTRRYLELVVNRYGLNPQPKVSLIVEGPTEERAIIRIFERYFGAHPGKYGIEVIVLGGVDVATGEKEDRFRAILRLIDYLHHHQTITFLTLDNERYARKLKAAARATKSIHHQRRYITRVDYIKIWRRCFEFDNFSCFELTVALNKVAGNKATFTREEIDCCAQQENSGTALKNLYKGKLHEKLDKGALIDLLLDQMFEPGSRRKISNRPLVKVLERVRHLAARNPFPVMHSIWEKNQASKYLGKKRP